MEFSFGEIIVDEKIEIEELKLDVKIEKVVTSNYDELNNLPKINDFLLVGNKNSEQLGLQPYMSNLTNMEIENLLK